MKKDLLALIFTALTVIFILVSFFSPWYNFQINVNSNLTQNEMKYNLDLYLSKAVFKGEVFDKPISLTYDYSNIRDLISKIPGYTVKSSSINQVLGVFDTTKFFVILIIIFSITALIGTISSVFHIIKFNLLKNLNMTFYRIFFSLTIISILYFMFAWHGMIQTGISLFLSVTSIIPIPLQITEMGFWYSINQNGYQISMGPGFSWYLLIFGAIFGLLAVIFTSKNAKLNIKNE